MNKQVVIRQWSQLNHVTLYQDLSQLLQSKVKPQWQAQYQCTTTHLAWGHQSHSGAWTPELHGPRRKTPCPWPLSCPPPAARQPGTECCCRCAAVSPANRHLKVKDLTEQVSDDFAKHWNPQKAELSVSKNFALEFFFIGFSCVCRQQKLLQKFPRLKRNLRKRKKNTTTSVYYYASSVYLAKGQQCRDVSALWILFTHIYTMGGGGEEGRGSWWPHTVISDWANQYHSTCLSTVGGHMPTITFNITTLQIIYSLSRRKVDHCMTLCNAGERSRQRLRETETNRDGWGGSQYSFSDLQLDGPSYRSGPWGLTPTSTALAFNNPTRVWRSNHAINQAGHRNSP